MRVEFTDPYTLPIAGPEGAGAIEFVPGDVADVSEEHGNMLLSMGLAKHAAIEAAAISEEIGILVDETEEAEEPTEEPEPAGVSEDEPEEAEAEPQEEAEEPTEEPEPAEAEAEPKAKKRRGH